MAKNTPPKADEKPWVMAATVLERTEDGYIGSVDYFGIELWIRAIRWGAGIKIQILDGKP
jgi:hypothetical protein